MIDNPLEFLHKLTGHHWDTISPLALQHRKTPDVPASVVAVVSRHDENLLDSDIHPMKYYLPYDETFHAPHRVLWEDYLEKGVLKYGAEVMPAVQVDFEDLQKISLKRLIYPYIIEGELQLTGSMILSNIRRANNTTFNATTFSMHAGSELGDIINSFKIDFFKPGTGFSIGNTILGEFCSVDIDVSNPPELAVTLSPNGQPVIKQYKDWKIEYQLGYEFKGTATLIPPNANAQDQPQESMMPLTTKQTETLGMEIAMGSLFIFIILAVPVGL